MIKKGIVLFFLLGTFNVLIGQDGMTNQKIEDVLTGMTNEVSGYPGYWEMLYRDRQLVCLTDEDNNRMRIISPIIEAKSLEKELLLDLLTANFHAALDVKYAISQGVLWSVYIHPLEELSDGELEGAINQVVNAVDNFGTTFSSTKMVFGGNSPQKITEIQEEEKPIMQKL